MGESLYVPGRQKFVQGWLEVSSDGKRVLVICPSPKEGDPPLTQPMTPGEALNRAAAIEVVLGVSYSVGARIHVVDGSRSVTHELDADAARVFADQLTREARKVQEHEDPAPLAVYLPTKVKG